MKEIGENSNCRCWFCFSVNPLAILQKSLAFSPILSSLLMNFCISLLLDLLLPLSLKSWAQSYVGPINRNLELISTIGSFFLGYPIKTFDWVVWFLGCEIKRYFVAWASTYCIHMLDRHAELLRALIFKHPYLFHYSSKLHIWYTVEICCIRNPQSFSHKKTVHVFILKTYLKNYLNFM